MCLLRLLLWANPLPHFLHTNGFSPVCLRRCTSYLDLCRKNFPQYPQWKRLIPSNCVWYCSLVSITFSGMFCPGNWLLIGWFVLIDSMLSETGLLIGWYCSLVTITRSWMFCPGNWLLIGWFVLIESMLSETGRYILSVKMHGFKVLSEGVQLWQSFLWGEGRSQYKYRRAIIGLQRKRYLNGVSLACRWWPNFECWLGSIVIF